MIRRIGLIKQDVRQIYDLLEGNLDENWIACHEKVRIFEKILKKMGYTDVEAIDGHVFLPMMHSWLKKGDWVIETTPFQIYPIEGLYSTQMTREEVMEKLVSKPFKPYIPFENVKKTILQFPDDETRNSFTFEDFIGRKINRESVDHYVWKLKH